MDIPGSAALQAVISDECRTNRGDEGAIDEALERARRALLDMATGWPVGKGAKFRVAVLIERPE